MLDKSTYYHGAAIIPILEDARCRSIRKREYLGYVVNEEVFVFLKYTTKSGTPWRFTFDQEDINRAEKMSREYRHLVFGFVCGGDGVCGVDGPQCRHVLGTKPAWIAAARRHNQRYEVWGTEGALPRKVSLNRWPSLIFEQEAIRKTNGDQA
ncbi:MAG: hypothetical protein K9G48_11305 [Reyranella sp.]|nr:hypothetical protein [Parvibaculum sp.]MCF8533583.1 hypothetical protein [Reyranella sp.]